MSIGLLVLQFRPYLEVVTNASKTNQHDESTVDRHCKPKYFLMCFVPKRYRFPYGVVRAVSLLYVDLHKCRAWRLVGATCIRHGQADQQIVCASYCYFFHFVFLGYILHRHH